MAWAKIDDQFADHPKVIAAGPLASWLYVCGLTYCARLLTDGFIPTGQVRKLADLDRALDLAQILVGVGLWTEVAGGYLVHDYLEYNPSRERVLATREVRAQAGSRGGKQKASNLLDVSLPVATDNVVAKSYPVPQPVPHPHPDPGPQPQPGGGGGEAPKRAGARHPLPSADELVSELEEWSVIRGYEAVLRAEVERFRDHCLTKIDPETGWPPGSRKPLYVDYAAACRKWITNPNFPHVGQGPARASPGGAADLTAAQPKRTRQNIEAGRRFLERHGDGQGGIPGAPGGPGGRDQAGPQRRDDRALVAEVRRDP